MANIHKVSIPTGLLTLFRPGFTLGPDQVGQQFQSLPGGSAVLIVYYLKLLHLASFVHHRLQQPAPLQPLSITPSRFRRAFYFLEKSTARIQPTLYRASFPLRTCEQEDSSFNPYRASFPLRTMCRGTGTQRDWIVSIPTGLLFLFGPSIHNPSLDVYIIVSIPTGLLFLFGQLTMHGHPINLQKFQSLPGFFSSSDYMVQRTAMFQSLPGFFSSSDFIWLAGQIVGGFNPYRASFPLRK